MAKSSNQQQQYPSYSTPSGLIARLAWAIVVNKRRSFRKDALLALKGMEPVPVIHHPENAPEPALAKRRDVLGNPEPAIIID